MRSLALPLLALVAAAACELSPYAGAGAPGDVPPQPALATPGVFIQTKRPERLASWVERPRPAGEVGGCRAYLAGGQVLLWSSDPKTCEAQRFDGVGFMPMSREGAPEGLASWWAGVAADQLVVYGHSAGVHRASRYDPVRDAWSDTATFEMGQAPVEVTAVSAGDKLLLWGGYDELPAGVVMPRYAKYDPLADEWRPMNDVGMASPRYGHGVVWDSHHMFVFGGRSYDGELLGDGGLYDEPSEGWEPVVVEGAPSPRSEPAIAWTGHIYVVVGGRDADGQALADGAIYCPEPCWKWEPLASCEPGFDGAAPQEPQAVWTGEQVLLAQTALPFRLARYHVDADAWAPVTIPPSLEALDPVDLLWDWDEHGLWLWGHDEAGPALWSYFPPFHVDPRQGHPGDNLAGNQVKP
ncbi:MAG: hypothetical protein KC731_42540 [Myxococcales bacterium]|nr:hypothetical protein [Myxococcales bacterium]